MDIKILVIGYTHKYNDKRVFRTVNAFKKIGKVYYQYAGIEKHDESNLTTFPMKIPPTSNRLGFYKEIYGFDSKILNLVKNLDYDIAYFHYFPITMPLKIFKEVKKRKKTLIFDLHEIIPEQFLSEKYEKLKRTMWWIFKKQLKLCDGIVSISEEALNFMLNRTKVKIPNMIVENYALIKIHPLSLNERKKEIVIVGSTDRNIETSKKLYFNLKKLGFLIKTIGLDVELADIKLPFLPYEKMMKEISKSFFTMITYQNRKDPDYPNEKYSLPNKFFDSLAAGTPVILSSRFLSMKKILEQLNVGVVLDLRDNIETNMDKILHNINDYPNLIESIKRNIDKFVWNETKEKEFLDFVISLSHRRD
ncbi:glycosyltransferase [Thermosipho atlanticus]|uniref:Glycosyltransferase involved in cell wall bisynthesis n=1 Tax=Thermosipho atlanticus DSM 15807 TaxID=1123380 RepID=A0A1M5RPL6_9BACT|nr:glycosyltransferase [Thermosipho atlanticus]SHH28071.1 Glycosyltransferase involved in cell wall bisynthesis [Thermosipho atlanticus DSM 15807]